MGIPKLVTRYLHNEMDSSMLSMEVFLYNETKHYIPWYSDKNWHNIYNNNVTS